MVQRPDKELERLNEIAKRYGTRPTDPLERFVWTVSKLEERYDGHKYADAWLIDREALLAARNAINTPKLF